MKKSLILSLSISAAIVAIIAVVLTMIVRTDRDDDASSSSPSVVLADDTHVLGEPGDGTVTVVEFLDLECEACGAFYPYVEELREEYAGEVTFAFRYFPLPGHGNAMNAAVAVEAAARQDALEPMYSRMFETQLQWGERGDDSQAPLFRQYADDLGLDLDQYDADVADPAVEERVQADFDAGVALGVASTPTFFVNDQPVELTSFDSLRESIEAALRD